MTEISRSGTALVMLRCVECGDTFAVDAGGRICRSCGGADVDSACEPLL